MGVGGSSFWLRGVLVACPLCSSRWVVWLVCCFVS